MSLIVFDTRNAMDVDLAVNASFWSNIWWQQKLNTQVSHPVVGNKFRQLKTAVNAAAAGVMQLTKIGQLANVELEGRFTYSASISPAPAIHFRTGGVYPGTIGADPTNGYKLVIAPGGFTGLSKRVANTGSALGSNTTLTLAGQITNFKVRANGTSLQSKVWTGTGSEPGSWSHTATDSSFSTGYIALAYAIGANANADNIDWTYFKVTDLDRVTYNPIKKTGGKVKAFPL